MTLFFFIALVFVAAAGALFVRALTLSRARTLESLSQVESYGYSTGLADATRDAKPTVIGLLASFLGGIVMRRLPLEREAELRTQLIAAGLYKVSARRFMGYRALTVIVLPLVFLTLFGGLSAASVFILPLSMAGGWYIPMRIVKIRAGRRLQEIEHSLPDLIDVLVVTIEAGLGFSASVQLASERLDGALGQELRLMLQEQRMGLSTHEALRGMLSRSDTPAMRSFIRAVLQGETLGVSIAQIMRSLATEMRKRRRAAAEERAQKAPVKILFPLVFLIFPAMFIVLLAPAVFSFLKAFGGV